MGYRVSGTLKLPDGTLGTNCEIEFTSRKNFTPVLTGMGVSIRTDSAGAYDVTLEYGAYAVILRTGNTYPTAIGQIIVASDTVVGQDLPTLLEQSGWQPATPEYIQQITKWMDRAESAATRSEASAVKSADDVAAQAALAKSQADRAKAEADRASQISGLGTVSDAIGLAAMPLPDVWAPLSDSLRMITGYGRDVLVGSDVVARMANFSRSTTRTYTAKDGTLKIAAINEPCFEKEGLHLDVQSTNLIPSFPISGANVTVQKTTLPQLAIPVYRITVPAGADGHLVVQTAKEAAVYTASMWTTVESGIPTAFWLQTNYRGSDGVLKAATVALSQSALERRRVTCTNAVAGPSDNFIYISNSGGASPCVVLVAGWQLEALAWASSYIPTDGAAVTRAGDLLQFIGPGNHPDIQPGVPFTFAMRMSCEETATDTYRDVLACPNIGYNLLRRSGSSIRYYREGAEQLSISAPGRKMNVIAVKVTAENSCTLRVGASQATRTEVPIVGGKVTTVDITNVAGHVRDFRIWQQALTDEQIKAIA